MPALLEVKNPPAGLKEGFWMRERKPRVGERALGILGFATIVRVGDEIEPGVWDVTLRDFDGYEFDDEIYRKNGRWNMRIRGKGV